jgi:hypothetical protein
MRSFRAFHAFLQLRFVKQLELDQGKTQILMEDSVAVALRVSVSMMARDEQTRLSLRRDTPLRN